MMKSPDNIATLAAPTLYFWIPERLNFSVVFSSNLGVLLPNFDNIDVEHSFLDIYTSDRKRKRH